EIGAQIGERAIELVVQPPVAHEHAEMLLASRQLGTRLVGCVERAARRRQLRVSRDGGELGGPQLSGGLRMPLAQVDVRLLRKAERIAALGERDPPGLDLTERRTNSLALGRDLRLPLELRGELGGARDEG